MNQQINLYQPIFREEDKLFSAHRMTIGLALFAMGLVLISVFSWWRTAALDSQLLAIKSQESAHERLVTGVNAMLDRGETQAQIEQRLRSMAFDLQRRQQALQYLHSDAVGAKTGFADRMEALARQQIDGLWLRGATFTADAGRLSLSGRTTNAELVPVYLARLAGEAALAGTKLELMEIREPKSAEHGELEFMVSSAKTGAAAPAAAAPGAAMAGGAT